MSKKSIRFIYDREVRTVWDEKNSMVKNGPTMERI